MQINEKYLEKYLSEVVGKVGKQAHKREIERLYRYVGKEPNEITSKNIIAYRELLSSELKLSAATVKRAFAILERVYPPHFLILQRPFVDDTTDIQSLASSLL